MRLAKTSLLVVFGAVLVLSSAGCLDAAATDAQAMQCCASMPCTPAHHGQDCCQNMVTGPSSYAVLPAGASPAPPLVAERNLPASELARRVPDVPGLERVSAREHSPPRELDTVYLALLI